MVVADAILQSSTFTKGHVPRLDWQFPTGCRVYVCVYVRLDVFTHQIAYQLSSNTKFSGVVWVLPSNKLTVNYYIDGRILERVRFSNVKEQVKLSPGRHSKFQVHIFCRFEDYFCCGSSVTQLCPTLCDPINCSTPGLPVLPHLLQFTQTHVHWVRDVMQLSHPLSSLSPPALNLSQKQGLFQWVSSLYQVNKVWPVPWPHIKIPTLLPSL